MSRPAAEPSRAHHRWLPLVLIVLGFAVYANTWHVPFVYDDQEAILTNRSIERLADLGTVLRPPAEGGLTVSGRPLLNLSFAVNFAVSGRAPWSYHLTNTFIHVLAGCVLFGLVRRTLAAAGKPRIAGAVLPAPTPIAGEVDAAGVAFFSAALWLVHPLCTQAVTYTVQRAESLLGLFYLLTVYGFARAAETRGSRTAARSAGWLVLSVVAGLAGAATKEVIITAPLLTFLYARTFATGSFRSAWREWRGYWIALGLVWLLVALLVASTGGNRGGTVGFNTGVPAWAYPLTQVQAVARYLTLSGWPNPLVFEYGTFWVTRTRDLLPYLPAVVVALGGTVWALRRAPRVGYAGAWFFGILAPTSLAPGTIQMVVEHRMYLPLAGVVTLIVTAASRVGGRRVLPLGVAAIVALGLTTFARNRDYATAVSLWSDTVAKRPENGRAHDGLADALAKAGQPVAALRHWSTAVQLMPHEGRYRYNLALALVQAGRAGEAVAEYQRAARLLPTDASVQNNLAVALTAAGRIAEALAHARRAVELKPNDPDLVYNLALAELRNGHGEAARAGFARVIDANPRDAGARLNLGNLLLEAGDLAGAAGHYRAGLVAAPMDNELETMLGSAELLAGRHAEAERHFDAVVQRTATAGAPGSPGAPSPVATQRLEALFGLGELRRVQGRPAEARTFFEAVLAGEPNHGRAHYKLGNLWMEMDDPHRAVSHYEAALAADPRDAAAFHHLGLAHARLGNWRQAREAIRHALKLRPDLPDARRQLEHVEQMIR